MGVGRGGGGCDPQANRTLFTDLGEGGSGEGLDNGAASDISKNLFWSSCYGVGTGFSQPPAHAPRTPPTRGEGAYSTKPNKNIVDPASVMEQIAAATIFNKFVPVT